MTMTNSRMMVMPPIYRFTLPDHPEESKWGWHRAVELVEAINNIRALKLKQSMTPEQINEAFPFARLNVGEFMERCSPVVQIDERFGGHFVGEINWLATVVRQDYYIPAKLGMQLINAVKNPAYRVFKNMLADEV